MHGYPAGRDDFARLLSNVEALTRHVADVGFSFVLDSRNYHEVAMAADVFLPRALRSSNTSLNICRAIPSMHRGSGRWPARFESCWTLPLHVGRAESCSTINSTRCSAGIQPQPLQTTPRHCLTSLLRLVISTHGCYTCTPYRGEGERRVGDILRQSLQSVVESALRSRRCQAVQQGVRVPDQNERCSRPKQSAQRGWSILTLTLQSGRPTVLAAIRPECVRLNTRIAPFAPGCSCRSLGQDEAIIRRSGLFDSEYYRAQVLAPSESMRNPIRHYLRRGAALGLIRILSFTRCTTPPSIRSLPGAP